MDISSVQINDPIIHFVAKNTEEMGIYYGYPACCIKQYIDNKNNNTANFFLLQNNTTGFIPCDECTERINLGDVRIEDLIQNRICPFPFPRQN